MWSVSIEQILWAGGFIGHVVLLSILIARHRTRHLPVFTALIAYNILQSIFLFVLFQTESSRQQYFYFWRATTFGYLLESAFIFEMAFAVMRATGMVVKQALMLFLFWSTLGAGLAAMISHALTGGKATGWDLWDMRATYFATSMTCFLYLAMLNAVNLWHLPWRSHVMTLGQGFAIWQFVSTLMDSAHIWSGWRWADKVFDDVSKSVYLGVLVFWMIRLWFPERELSVKPSAESERLIARLAEGANMIV